MKLATRKSRHPWGRAGATIRQRHASPWSCVPTVAEDLSKSFRWPLQIVAGRASTGYERCGTDKAETRYRHYFSLDPALYRCWLSQHLGQLHRSFAQLLVGDEHYFPCRRRLPVSPEKDRRTVRSRVSPISPDPDPGSIISLARVGIVRSCSRALVERTGSTCRAGGSLVQAHIVKAIANRLIRRRHTAGKGAGRKSRSGLHYRNSGALSRMGPRMESGLRFFDLVRPR